MLNNINLYSSLLNSTATYSSNASSSTNTSTEVQAIIDKHASQSVKTDPTEPLNNSHLYLTNKSQKISAISNEFFNKGGLSFVDVDALKERIYQLGLISKEEYAKLTKSDSSERNTPVAESMSTKTLVNYIHDFKERLNKIDIKKDSNASGENETESETLAAFNTALNTAQHILTDVEEAKRQPDFKKSLQSALSILKDTIDAKSFELMPLDDKIGLSKVTQTLDIVDQLTPQRLTNEKINRYIDLSFR